MILDRRRSRRLCHILVLTTTIGVIDSRPFFRRINSNGVVFVRPGGAESGDQGLPGTILETNMDTTRVIIETASTTSSSAAAAILDGDDDSSLLYDDEDESENDTVNNHNKEVDGEPSPEDNTSPVSSSFETFTASEPRLATEAGETTDTTSTSSSSSSSIPDQVSTLRIKGKRLHDEGSYEEAATCFGTAANLLEDSADDSEDFFTLKLHQALCCLKLDDNEMAVQICTEVLENNNNNMPIVLRARALHRRAKAYLGMEDRQNALDDARSAAMFGDAKAVELYGKIMREERRRGMMRMNNNYNGAAMNIDETSSSSSSSYFSPDTLLESLLSKSGPSATTGSSNGDDDDDPMAAMFAMQNLFGNSGDDSLAASGDSLAKSVLSSVSKRLDDDATQEMISAYLQGVEGPQLTQLAEMAGIPLNPDHASRIANFCQTTTKQGIRKMVKLGRRIFYTGRLIRKTMKVIAKYKNVLIFTSILWWISSAITRPLPSKSIQLKTAVTSKQKAKTTTTAATGTTPVGLLKHRR